MGIKQLVKELRNNTFKEYPDNAYIYIFERSGESFKYIYHPNFQLEGSEGPHIEQTEICRRRDTGANIDSCTDILRKMANAVDRGVEKEAWINYKWEHSVSGFISEKRSYGVKVGNSYLSMGYDVPNTVKSHHFNIVSELGIISAGLLFSSWFYYFITHLNVKLTVEYKRFFLLIFYMTMIVYMYNIITVSEVKVLSRKGNRRTTSSLQQNSNFSFSLVLVLVLLFRILNKKVHNNAKSMKEGMFIIISALVFSWLPILIRSPLTESTPQNFSIYFSHASILNSFTICIYFLAWVAMHGTMR